MAKTKEGINGTFITKEEAKKMGYDYDVYDYKAEMIATAPGTTIVKGVFRVIQDMAVLMNERGDGYFIVKIGDPKNKGIDFVQVNDQIMIANKEKVYGDTFSVKELLKAIKNPIFRDDAVINVHGGDTAELLSLVYKCKSCNKIHLIGGELNTEDYDDLTQNAEKVYTKNPLLVQLEPVTRGELVEILESIKEDAPITIGLAFDDGMFTLTGVYKCSPECPAIHLTCYYSEHSHNKN